MKTIWKYELQVTDEQTIAMPKDCDFLTVQVQNGKPCLWASVDSNSPEVDQKILTIGTGNPIPKDTHADCTNYIGTYQLNGGRLVFHVFHG